MCSIQDGGEMVMDRLKDQMKNNLENCDLHKERDTHVAKNIINELYMTQPYLAAYETLFNGKAGYDKIMENFQKAREYLVDKNTAELYLVALIDTLENISEEIFEYYRSFQIHLREEIEKVMESQWIKSSPSTAYVIMKAVRLGHLSEDYQRIGINIFESLVHQKPDDVISFMKAYEEYLYLQK